VKGVRIWLFKRLGPVRLSRHSKIWWLQLCHLSIGSASSIGPRLRIQECLRQLLGRLSRRKDIQYFQLVNLIGIPICRHLPLKQFCRPELVLNDVAQAHKHIQLSGPLCHPLSVTWPDLDYWYSSPIFSMVHWIDLANPEPVRLFHPRRQYEFFLLGCLAYDLWSMT